MATREGTGREPRTKKAGAATSGSGRQTARTPKQGKTGKTGTRAKSATGKAAAPKARKSASGKATGEKPRPVQAPIAEQAASAADMAREPLRDAPAAAAQAIPEAGGPGPDGTAEARSVPSNPSAVAPETPAVEAVEVPGAATFLPEETTFAGTDPDRTEVPGNSEPLPDVMSAKAKPGLPCETLETGPQPDAAVSEAEAFSPSETTAAGAWLGGDAARAAEPEETPVPEETAPIKEADTEQPQTGDAPQAKGSAPTRADRAPAGIPVRESHPVATFLAGAVESFLGSDGTSPVIDVDPGLTDLPLKKLQFFAQSLHLLGLALESRVASKRHPTAPGPSDLRVRLEVRPEGRIALRCFDGGLFWYRLLPDARLGMEVLRPLVWNVVREGGSICLRRGRRCLELEIIG